jgi:hypothetical protein
VTKSGSRRSFIAWLHRFQQVLRQIARAGPLDWAAVALAGAYCDQAHLAGELRDFSCIHAE